MSVENTHRLYRDKKYVWRMVRDALEGGDRVKRANVIYLPMPAGFAIDDTSAQSAVAGTRHNLGAEYSVNEAPYYHPNPAYRGYLQRARFPDITLNTLRGLVGVATKKAPVMDLPSQMAYLENRATNTGRSLIELYVTSIIEVLSTGNGALVVDIDSVSNEARIVLYRAECITNWRVNEKNGETEYVILHEVGCKAVEGDEFEVEDVERHIVMQKYPDDSDAAHEGESLAGRVVTTHYEDGEIVKRVIPSLQGAEFDRVPVFPLGSLQNDFTPNPSPLAAIADIAYSIYRKDADLSQAQFMTCNPILTLTGVSGDQVPIMAGSTVALLLERPDSQAFYPQTDTSGLNHVAASIKDLFDEAARQGATLLGPGPSVGEATETVRIRQGAQGATLVGVVMQVEEAMLDAMGLIAEMEGADPSGIVFSASTDFAEITLNPQMALALLQLWQNGLYSKESFIALLIGSGFIDKDDDVEDELTRIFAEGPGESV